MSKLTRDERAGFKDIMLEDMKAINDKLIEQIQTFWTKAREEVLIIKGWDKLMEEKKKLYKEQDKIETRINNIENKLNDKPLKTEQIIELGGRKDKYGRFVDANFYGIPVTSRFEYDVVKFIKKHINLEMPVKFLFDLGRSCIRELTMSGSFEDARKTYQKFYSMDFRKYGVDIPPRLDDAKKEKETLLISKQVLGLSDKSKDSIKDVKLLESKKVRKAKK